MEKVSERSSSRHLTWKTAIFSLSKPSSVVIISFIIVVVVSFILTVTLDNGYAVMVDGWYDYATVIEKAILQQPNDILSFMRDYDHSFTPLYPIIAAMVNIVINNMAISIYCLNFIFSVGSVLLMKRIIDYSCPLPANEKSLILVMYMMNVIVIITFFVLRVTDSFMIFITLSAYLCNTKLANSPSMINSLKAVFINTIVLFSREIIWVMLFVPLIFYLVRLLSSRLEGNHILFKDFVKEFLLIAYAITVPCVIYVAFLYTFDLFGAVSIRYLMLRLTYRTPWGFMWGFLAVFNFLIFFFFAKIKQVFLTKENRPLLIWLIVFITFKIISPGPFWAYYWLPVVFCFVILTWIPIRDNFLKKKATRIVILYSSLNLGACILFILIPDLPLAIVYNMFFM